MNKKNLKKTAALMLGLALTVGATGCNFIVTDNARDLEQTVATIDISAALKEDERYGEEVASAVSEIIGKSEISKRDLVTYFLSAGSSYAESYGYEYTFNMLLDTLINREIIIQYAVADYIADKNNALTLDGHNKYVNDAIENAEKADAKKAELLKAHPEVLTYEYFLTENGADFEDYNRAVYNMKKSLNSSLDSLETQFIKTKAHDHDSTEEARTLPTGVNAAKEDYYTTNYGIYTGRNSLAECGDYEKQDGSTMDTRRSAYNSLLSNLHSYGLISTNGKMENPTNLEELDYYYVELSSALMQALINKYYEDLEEKVESKMDATYVQGKYDALLAEQTRAYTNKPTEFKTAMDGVSDSSFLLYGTENFGFVYNILVPFSAAQEIEYAMYKGQGLTTNNLYLKRKALWSQIKAEDQRSTWITDDEHTNYSYQGEDGNYYFFENHFDTEKADQYEKLSQYAGKYAFQGEVVKDADGEIEKINKQTNKSVDGVLEDMLALIKTESGLGYTENTDVKTAYENMTTYTTDDKKDGEGNVVMENGVAVQEDDDIVEDYSKFIYRSGKVNFTATPSANDFFNPASESYKALSAVNEIMFAYSTDPGCLNSYMGYVVSPYGNGYVSEFEAAAQWAVEEGVGSWAVVPTDFGWHIIYCSFKYDGGEVYSYDHAQAVGASMVEGSFSKMFYDSLKDKMVSNTTSEIQSMVLNQFNNDQAVQKFQKAYQDLLDM